MLRPGLESYFEGSRRRRPHGALGLNTLVQVFFKPPIEVESSLNQSQSHFWFRSSTRPLVRRALQQTFRLGSGLSLVESSQTRPQSWFFSHELDHRRGQNQFQVNEARLPVWFSGRRPRGIASILYRRGSTRLDGANVEVGESRV